MKVYSCFNFYLDLQKKENEIKRKLNKLKHLIIPQDRVDTNTQKKISRTMESKRETEFELYSEDPSSGNVLTRFEITLQKTKQARETNATVLNTFPSDITARYLRIEILVKEKKFSEAKNEIESLDNLMNNEGSHTVFLVCAHKADVACYLSQIGPVYYVKSIEYYEEAVKDLLALGSTSLEDSERRDLDIEKHLVLWRFKLIVLYNRMLNQGSIFTHGKGKPDLNPLDIFHKMCTLVGNVVNSKYEHNLYRARSYIEIMIAHQKLRGEQNDETTAHIRKAIGYPEMESKLCIEYALTLAPNDGSVLEKVGRYYRYHAKNMEEFQEAVKLLEKCLRVCPSRHVALHHLSLSYKSMWILSNNFGEAKVYDNPIRTGQRSKSKRKRGKGRGSAGVDVYSHLAEHFDPTTAQRTKDERPCKTERSLAKPKEYRCQTHSDDTFKNQPCSMGNAGYNSFPLSVNASQKVEPPQNKKLTRQSENSDAESLATSISKMSVSSTVTPTETLKARWPGSGETKPKQNKRPDYFDKPRTSNPMRNESTCYNEYLEKAIAALEDANKIVSDSGNRYHIDLARLYVSNCEFAKAEESFVKAEQYSIDSLTCRERAYLFEQWALFKHSSGLDEDALDDVKRMYREVVTYSVRANENSRMAFYRLRDIIKSQFDSNPDDSGIKREMALLQKLVENFDHAKRTIREILESDPKNIEMIFNLLDV